MTSTFVNGAKYAVSTQFKVPAVISALSNAIAAVATTSTPPAAGEIVVLQSGWSELTDSVARASNPTATGFTLEGVDTTDAVRFPAGEGIGTYASVQTFVGLSQVRDVDQSGGDQNFYEYQNVEDQSSRQRQDPTFKSPIVLKLELAYDPKLPWYAALVEIDRKRKPVVLRETLPTGDVILYYGMLSFKKIPSKRLNEHMLVELTMSLYSDPIRYDVVAGA